MKKIKVINRAEVSYALRSSAQKRAAFSPRAGRQAAEQNRATSE